MDQPTTKNDTSRGAIIYIADPMCSWCYGFRDEITQLKEQHADQMDFHLIMGGLRPGGGDPWDQKMKDFLRHHWEQVGEASGQLFSYGLFDKDHFHYDTEPACRAVRVSRDLAPEKELDFFKAIQFGFYFENRDPKEASFYIPICKELEIDYAAFLAKFSSEDYKALTRQDFEQSAQWGIRGFPSVVVRWQGRLGLLSNGYARLADMNTRMEQLVTKLSQAV